MNPACALEPKVQQALERLQGLLPLARRLSEQSTSGKRVHRAILCELARSGVMPGFDTLERLARPEQLGELLESLAAADLIVRTPAGAIAGAYPFTLEHTPHRLTLPGATVNAMCAVDALAVAPMFGRAVATTSACAVTGAAIEVRQHGRRLMGVSPRPQPSVGIGWRNPHSCAAHSLCRDMIFLRDHEVAASWRESDPQTRALYSVDEAVAIGAAFFAPLLAMPD